MTLDELLAKPERAYAQAEAEDVEKAIAWLHEKWGDERPCPYCGNVQWNVGTPDISQGAPVFPVTCTNCGNAVFINALVAGVVDARG